MVLLELEGEGVEELERVVEMEGQHPVGKTVDGESDGWRWRCMTRE